MKATARTNPGGVNKLVLSNEPFCDPCADGLESAAHAAQLMESFDVTMDSLRTFVGDADKQIRDIAKGLDLGKLFDFK